MISERKAKRYCKEDISKIENYEKAIADTTQTWVCHHRTEIWWNCTPKDLIDNECYYNRKACELIFLTPSEHISLHNRNISECTRRKRSESLKGKSLSEEHRKKLSESMKGKTLSEEHRRKISESLKGNTHTDDTKRKISEAQKGKHLSKETIKKISEAKKGHPPTKGSKGMHWYNNGVENVLTYTCPEGYNKGRMK